MQDEQIRNVKNKIEPFRDKTLLPFLGLRPLIIAFLISVSYPILYDIPRPFLFIFLVSSLLVPIFYSFSKILKRTGFYYAVFVTDAILVTFLVLYSGGSESLFPLLYLLIVLASSIYLYRGAIAIALISFGFYSILIYVELRGGVFPIQYFYAQTYLYGILLFLVAYISSNLTTKARRARITTAEIIGSLPVYIAAIDKDGNLYYSNIHDDRMKNLVSEFHNAKKGYAEKVVDERIYSLSSHPLNIAPELRLIMVEDITREKKIAARTRLYEKLKLLAQLGASLAHEIRNPLASIRGVAEIIGHSKLSPKHKDLLTMAISEVDRASRTIEDFLEFSRMRPLKLRKVRLRNILEDLLAAEPLPDNINLRLNFMDNKTIRVDCYLFYRVLSNLIRNAEQAIGNRKGKIEISSIDDDDFTKIIISDDGKGIPKKNLKKIFDPFFSTREEGTGLGLAIVETILSQHNGKVSVDSISGKGTTFTISLPKKYE